MENNYLQIRQKAGTDSLLREFIWDNAIEEDTIYAFMYRPGNCPRCEAGFKLFRKWLNERGRKFTLISVGGDAGVSDYYNRMKGYMADYYINDTTGMYGIIFSFNNIPLDGSNVLKISRDGRLITGGDFTELCPEFVDQLVARTEPMPYKTYEQVSSDECVEDLDTLSFERFREEKTFTLDGCDIPLCKVDRAPIWNGRWLCVPDDILNGVFVFEERRKRFVFRQLASVQDDVKDNFIEVSDSMKAHYEKNGMLFYLLCNAGVDKDTLYMSYSIPKIVFTDSLKSRIGIFNQPCIIAHTLVGNASSDRLWPLDFNIFSEEYFYKHFQFAVAGGNVSLGCQQLTWPMEYEAEEYKDDSRRNPFLDEYYDYRHPYMADFRLKDGKLARRYGNLSEEARRTKTGYYFNLPFVTANGTETAYTDGFSGKVCVAGAASESVYDVFDFDVSTLPSGDSALFYTYEYADAFKKYFNRQIVDMQISDKELCCIVLHGWWGSDVRRKVYTFVRIDRRTGTKHEYLLPARQNLVCTGLRRDKSSVDPFQIVKQQGAYAVKLMK
ncbi:MAG: hypothetical protein NC344_09565 [Bacteroidales bacterium]|nr:hypothetical protein [Bacteroidales bacterium]MCM1148053.1 hypothetical protein [Bacteroidales bacterium]MCM1207250.1 hypothetical protein [Bacillota bacterium]MCM1509493.1 hypothetical protein [Clostridium sp.]